MIQNLIDTTDLTEKEIRYFLRVAQAFSEAVKKNQSLKILEGQTVVNLFFENSTRTRLSFEMATRKLGGGVMSFSASSSSVKKGETLIDTAKTIQAMRPHALVVRHASAGSPHVLSKFLTIPVINAGDGFHEHPTQALLDAFTIEQKLGTLSRKKVVIMGDIAHSRVARSNINILKKLGATVAVCAPPTLLPPSPQVLGVEAGYRPEDVLPDADVVMMLRVQFERQNKMQIPSVEEYSRYWGLNRERAALLKPGAIILHPGPVNRGVELDPDVADSDRSVILDQVYNGILVRMAVLAVLCQPEHLQQWLKKEGHHV